MYIFVFYYTSSICNILSLPTQSAQPQEKHTPALILSRFYICAPSFTFPFSTSLSRLVHAKSNNSPMANFYIFTFASPGSVYCLRCMYVLFAIIPLRLYYLPNAKYGVRHYDVCVILPQNEFIGRLMKSNFKLNEVLLFITISLYNFYSKMYLTTTAKSNCWKK